MGVWSRNVRRYTLGLFACGALLLVPCRASLASDGRLVEVRLLFQDARLIVEKGKTAKIVAGLSKNRPGEADLVLVPSSELEVHRLAPGLFQVVAKARKDPIWRVNALGHTMWAAQRAIIGTDGGWSQGNYVRHPSWVKVVPCSRDDALAGDVQLHISDLELVFKPDKSSLLIEGGMLKLSMEKTWDVKEVRTFLFHLRLKNHWKDQYLEVDAGGRALRLVRPGRSFGTDGEKGHALRVPVQVIRVGGRYSGPTVPKLVEPASGAVLDNGGSTGDKAVNVYRWTPVDGAELYEFSASGGWHRKVRQPRCVITWGGQSYGRGGRKWSGWWKVRAIREGRPLPWSKTRRTSDIEVFDTDRPPNHRDYLLDEPKKGRRGPVLVRPKPGAVLDNGRADGLDSLLWEFSWRRTGGAKSYEIVIVRGGDAAPFLRADVRGTKFQFRSDEYRIFGPRRKGWFWRVRKLGQRKPGPWSEKRRFHVEALDVDPARKTKDAAEPQESQDVPVLVSPAPGAALENGNYPKKSKPLYWTFRWKAVPGAEAYEFEYGARAGRLKPIQSERVAGTKLKVVGGPTTAHWKLTRCDWYWRVRAIRGGQPLSWSAVRPFDVVGRRK